jgi:hypothetical protein
MAKRVSPTTYVRKGLPPIIAESARKDALPMKEHAPIGKQPQQRACDAHRHSRGRSPLIEQFTGGA